MQFEVKIGARTVLASGQLVLGPGEREVTFTLEGMNCVMTFTPTDEPGPFKVHFDPRDRNHLFIDTRGQFPVGTVAWTYAGILRFTDADVDLDLMIHSDTAQLDSVRRLGFTFLAGPKGPAAVDDPTRSTPAAGLRHSGSAPPAIALPPA